MLGPLSESSSCILTTKNTTSKDVVFKIKTNAPRKYVVTPNEGLIRARDTTIIKGRFGFFVISVVATVAGVDSAGESRDRIALLSVLAPAEMPASLDQVVCFYCSCFN